MSQDGVIKQSSALPHVLPLSEITTSKKKTSPVPMTDYQQVQPQLLPRWLRLLLILVSLLLLLLNLLLHSKTSGSGAFGTILSRLGPSASEYFDAKALMERIIASEVAVGVPPMAHVMAAVLDAFEVTHYGERSTNHQLVSK